MKESLSKLQNSIEHLLVELITDIDYNHAISSSLQEYGIRMGKAIRKGIESQGIEPNLGDFMERYSTPCFCQYRTCAVQSGSKQFRIVHCPADCCCWMSKRRELGSLLCQLDSAVIKGFNPELEAKIVSSLKIGSKDYWFESEISLL
ncbi:hypothetical protein [Desulfitobacterium sp. AusDCA]|uniref:hypothetical protein n=1 Tax=Desulfitobacterium sp. AusDCA TaxID=3240383 RepID=UPI003DA6F362